MNIQKYVLAFFFLLLACILPYPVYAEEIASFSSAIHIQQNGAFTVVETIEYDFGSLQKHGIYRFLPVKKINTAGTAFQFTLDALSVEDAQGVPYTYKTSKTSDAVKVTIGDKDTFVTGKKQYVISYTVTGGLTYFSDHDELYWNSIGTDWTIPIQHALTTVYVPSGIADADIKASCFVGNVGETEKACEYSIQNGIITFRANTQLLSNQGMTIVVGFPKGIVAVVEPTKIVPWGSTLTQKILSILFVLASIFWYIVLPLWIVVHWFQRGRDPKPLMGEVKAWFAVPKAKDLRPLTPGETGTLIDEMVDMKEITGTIIDLARRGYIKIVEKKKNDFTLEQRVVKKKETLELFEKLLYEGIFGNKTTVRIKDADFVDVVKKTKAALYERVVTEKFFDENPEKTRNIYVILGVIGIVTFNLPLTLAAFLFGRVMPRKTAFGSQNAAVARSLRNFIVSQDRQFAFQAKNQLFFEKFLPYAIVFGVEKIWAERFKDVRLVKPDWYDGHEMRSFNSVLFVHSLETSMQSVASVATPTSSSSGFSSGFSGGSVGGGGGGGGGGSW